MDVRDQLHRLRTLGIAVDGHGLPDRAGAVVVVHPSLVPAATLATLLVSDGRPGFVVDDLTDLDRFEPAGVTIPDRPLYLIHDVERGDELRNRSPNEALPAITARGRSPLTISEGISWLLQEPERLERNHCFMTIASRKRKGIGLDSRTPAVWMSNAKQNKGAPKVGWCWAGNRHTWLGFASTAGRSAG
jgi:Family of unknown function (DUF5701)